MSERGTVKFFDPRKGFGFISRPKGEDVYVNIRDIEEGGPLTAGQEVEFEVRQTRRGPRAIHVVAQEIVPRYDFVPIHPKVRREKVPRHHQLEPGLLAGRLEFAVQTLGPLHVDTSVAVRSEDVDLEADDGVLAPQYRVDGRPAIPGSTLKGVVRSVAEAVSPSCVTSTQVDPFKLPEEVTDRRARRPCSAKRGVACPTCTLFGMMGYIGQVWFGDALLSPKGEMTLHRIPHLYRPRSNAATYYERRGNFKGRKFYIHGRPQTGEGPALEVIKPGQYLLGDLRFTNLTEAQLGLLFFALGLDGSFCLKIGAGKPVCLGSARILPASLSLEDGERLLGGSDAEETYREERLVSYIDQRIEEAWGVNLLLDEPVAKLREILSYEEKELEPCPTGVY